MQLIALAEELADQFEDIAYTEAKLVEAVPRMAQSTSPDELRETFEAHVCETRRQVARLGALFRRFDFQRAKHESTTIHDAEWLTSADADLADNAIALNSAKNRIEFYERSAKQSLLKFADLLAKTSHRQL